MAYSDYTLGELQEKYGMSNHVELIFAPNSAKVAPSEWLLQALAIAQELPVRSEKAKSELIVMPILIELRNRNEKYVTIYSGDSLNIDDKLKGECDFILAKDTGSFEMNTPILQVVEAKKNDVEIGIPQCAAQMIGAKKYNERKNISLNTIYGCVTTGDDWLFMKLTDKIVIDTRKYYLGNLSELLGAFQQIIDFFKQHNI